MSKKNYESPSVCNETDTDDFMMTSIEEGVKLDGNGGWENDYGFGD